MNIHFIGGAAFLRADSTFKIEHHETISEDCPFRLTILDDREALTILPLFSVWMNRDVAETLWGKLGQLLQATDPEFENEPPPDPVGT